MQMENQMHKDFATHIALIRVNSVTMMRKWAFCTFTSLLYSQTARPITVAAAHNADPILTFFLI
jgi:hypothetical protein